MELHQGRLPRRDLILMPLIVLATLVLLAGLSELVARGLFRESATSTMSCLVVDDPSTGVHAIPGSTCRQKSYESRLIDYRFNGCGFRTPQSCAPAPAGTYRIVMVGSSMAFGMHVSQPESLAGKLGPALSQRLGRPVEVFNEGMQWGTPASLALRTAAMLAPKPDMILWTLTPFDLENARLVLPYVAGVQPALESPAPPIDEAGGSTPPARPSLPERAWRRLIGELSDTRTVFMLQHALYRSESQFLSHTLAQGSTIDYLRVPTPAPLRDNLALFAKLLGNVAARARAAGVPLVVTLLPSRPQTIMLTNGQWEKGYDPNQLGRQLDAIARAQGARYVDMTRGIAAVPNAGQLFFAVDEHLPPEGHTMLTGLLANALGRSGAIPTKAEAAR